MTHSCSRTVDKTRISVDSILVQLTQTHVCTLHVKKNLHAHYKNKPTVDIYLFLNVFAYQYIKQKNFLVYKGMSPMEIKNERL